MKRKTAHIEALVLLLPANCLQHVNGFLNALSLQFYGSS